jgi:hypothetical protein
MNIQDLHQGKTKEIHHGYDGSGKKIFIVVTVKDGLWIWQERFKSEKEAIAWMRYA